MRYPQTFIDDLRRQADIVRVIQDYVPLKKKGANWMACCPFHKEKTPSFSVSPAKEIFYCFGCHKGGSVFNFVMEVESVPFPEAIKIVAEKSGVLLPKLVEDSRFEARRQEADEVIELNKWALEWWEQQLASGGAESRVVRDYLKKREISDETQKIFRLGYSPDSWEALSSYLRQKGALQTQIDRSGLVVKKDDGSGSYDRFRGRLMFPVMDIQGRPIAFGARTLKADDNVKYINSPETAAYVKGRNLFGLNLTRDEIRKQGFAILVEGFLDLIVPFQFGIRNGIASLGTALTTDQVKLLGRFARRVVVNYDGDRAGVQAAKRAIEMLLEEDLDVKVLVLPNKSDPDEFIRQQGAGEYQRLRGNAQPHIQFVIDQAVADRDLHRPAEKADAVEEVLPYIRAVRNRIQKREYFDIAIDALRIADPALKRELWYAVRSDLQYRVADVRKTLLAAPGAKPTLSEMELLSLLISNADVRKKYIPKISLLDYGYLPTAPLFASVIDLEKNHLPVNFNSVSSVIEDNPELTALLAFVTFEVPDADTHNSADSPIDRAQRNFEALRLTSIERRMTDLNNEMNEAFTLGNKERLEQLESERKELEEYRRQFWIPLEAIESV